MAYKKNNLLGLLIILGIVSAFVFAKDQLFTQKQNLPQHVITDDTNLAPKNGRRVEIRCSNPDLTRDEALALINHYKNRAGKQGQVSVHKPDKGNNYFPWAVLNIGEGIKFQDFFFEMLPERKGQVEKKLGLLSGSQLQSQALLNLINENPDKLEYQIAYQTSSGAAVFGCDFGKNVLIRINQHSDGNGTQEMWSDHVMFRLKNSGEGGSLNNTPKGKKPGCFQSFKGSPNKQPSNNYQTSQPTKNSYFLDLEKIEPGETWIVSKQTPLMPFLNPNDPVSALTKMKKIPASGGFEVLSKQYKTKGNPWYKVIAFDQNRTEIGCGWINSIALLGQQLKKPQSVPKTLTGQAPSFPAYEYPNQLQITTKYRLPANEFKALIVYKLNDKKSPILLVKQRKEPMAIEIIDKLPEKKNPDEFWYNITLSKTTGMRNDAITGWILSSDLGQETIKIEN